MILIYAIDKIKGIQVIFFIFLCRLLTKNYFMSPFHFLSLLLLLLPLPVLTSIKRFKRCRPGWMGRTAPTAGRGGGGEVQAAGAQPRPGAYQLGFVIVHIENSKLPVRYVLFNV